MTAAILPGFALGLSLILAIGAQNAFVLRQGLRREHVLWVALTCALSDAVLIAAGVGGMGRLATWFAPLMRWGGAAFLLAYGGRNLIAAARGGAAMQATATGGRGLRATLATCLALTWLNPHVYLDTVVLIGSVSAQYEDRFGFALGASAASLVFFFALAYGARLLAPLLARPGAWRLLDAGIGLVMWAIALRLILM
ncbi:LysE/ArgO family amino acid transporter [Pseudodonghicola flavimaris]|uniref:LysE/ArgO family amino acid transporter n=1 Tax=Pseudodonghicola flavimaris TaxID=3050036 RepID=A0ABT7F0L3_9RHOB|nr:LysE/ArgO family amino acid transporter [Pseudodonghicola flavimaris]MDK3018120.1 LysE/ArgO family amino acid transporter [Pseudodonghicola flavimaris]